MLRPRAQAMVLAELQATHITAVRHAAAKLGVLTLSYCTVNSPPRSCLLKMQKEQRITPEK